MTVLLGVIATARLQREQTAIAPSIKDLSEIGVTSIDVETLPADQAAKFRDEALTATQAIAEASKWAPVQNETKANAKLVILTDNHYGDVEANGNIKPIINERLVWQVTFTGISMTVGGPVGSSVDDAFVHSEITVVIDAKTGEFLRAYAYK